METEGTEIEQVSTELVLPPDAALALVAERLVDQAKHDGVALTGEGGLLTGLVQQVLQSALVGVGDRDDRSSRLRTALITRLGIGQLQERVVPENSGDRDRRCACPGPAGPQRQLRTPNRASRHPTTVGPRRTDHFALRQRVNDRRHRSSSARCVRQNHRPVHNLTDHRPDRKRGRAVRSMPCTR